MLSVIIIAKNEESRIKACLESVRWVDEIIVADNDSTDKTAEIAKQYTDKIYNFKTDDFSQLRNQAFQKAKEDWVLYVDADERVLEPLRDEIQELIQNPKDKTAYAISRKNIIFGQQVNYGPYQHDWVIRLVKRTEFEKWSGEVHEHLEFKGNLGYTKNSFLHLTHRNVDQFILKSLEWSKIDAQLRLKSGHPIMTKWRFLRILITEVYNQMIARKGAFGGTVGIIDSVLQVFFFYMTYVRLWQLQQPEQMDDIYNGIDQKLIKNGFNYK